MAPSIEYIGVPSFDGKLKDAHIVRVFASCSARDGVRAPGVTFRLGTLSLPGTYLTRFALLIANGWDRRRSRRDSSLDGICWGWSL